MTGRWVPVAGVVAAAVGLLLDLTAFGGHDVAGWAPDVMTGWVLLGCALVERRSAPGDRLWVLLAASGVAWFVGSWSPSLILLHRAVLMHAVVAFPTGRLGDRSGRATAAVGYAASLAPAFWSSLPGALAVSGPVLALAGLRVSYRVGPARREARFAAGALTAVSLVVVLGAAGRQVAPGERSAAIALLGYQIVVSAVAFAVVWTLRSRPAVEQVTDLVVDLGEPGCGGLQGALSRALGDPGLRLAFASPDGYVDEGGAAVDVPTASGQRAVTRVEHGGAPAATLVHDAALLDDPALTRALATAARLVADNRALQDALGQRVADVAASRHRVLVASDSEQQRLGRRLATGAQRQLAEVDRRLACARQSATGPTQALVAKAHQQLDRTRADLRSLAEGLLPRTLTELGLAGALAQLAAGSEVAVVVDSGAYRWTSDEVERAAWFVCTECVTNAVKHAAAAQVTVHVSTLDECVAVIVTDDGCGGADLQRGTGLRGLADRVQALGGRLEVQSTRGRGTTVTATLPTRHG
jgi:signal transduction histidine kinase